MVVIRKQSPRGKKSVKKKVSVSAVDFLKPIKTAKRGKSVSQNSASVIDRIAPIGFSEDDGIRIAIYGRGATGKCLGKGTPILFFDGSIELVEKVEVGDLLMGPDSEPRKVLSINVGRGKLYNIQPNKGKSWVCNEDHILCLTGMNHVKGKTRIVSVKDYLQEYEQQVSHYKSWLLYKVPVTFQENLNLPVPPYLVGLWMGDGTRGTCRIHNNNRLIHNYCYVAAHEMKIICKVTPDKRKDKNTSRIDFVTHEGSGQWGGNGNPLLTFFRNSCLQDNLKIIPFSYLVSSEKSRLELLAGIIDTDGETTNCSNTFIVVSGKAYRDSLLLLCRGLGFASYCYRHKRYTCKNGRVSNYYWLSIVGDLDKVPTLVRKFPKRKQLKRPLVTSFRITYRGVGQYYGFTLDRNGEFLLGDFTVTHNTTLAGTFPRPALWIICSGGKKPGELRSLDTLDNRKTIEQVVLEKSSDIEKLVNLQEETGKYATIVLDHVTSLQDHILREVLNLEKLPEQLSWGIATQQHWGQVGVKLKECLRKFCNLQCNVVIIAHEREFNVASDEALIEPSVSFALTSGNTSWLEGVVDYAVQTRIQPKMKTVDVKIGGKTVQIEKLERGEKPYKYTIRTGPDPVYYTKFRVPVGTEIPDEIVNPTYAKIMKLIKGAKPS